MSGAGGERAGTGTGTGTGEWQRGWDSPAGGAGRDRDSALPGEPAGNPPVPAPVRPRQPAGPVPRPARGDPARRARSRLPSHPRQRHRHRREGDAPEAWRAPPGPVPSRFPPAQPPRRPLPATPRPLAAGDEGPSAVPVRPEPVTPWHPGPSTAVPCSWQGPG